MDYTVDEKFMRLALKLARKGCGDVSPNPMVGAVVVKNGRIVGKGYHKFFGGPHAEVDALDEACEKAKGATLYVNLEPCNHFGKTPPCTGAIIKAGIKRVVVAMKDPNPINNGAGLYKLRRAGIKVEAGTCEKEARTLNAPFAKYITSKIPYVIVKSAESLDGKIATRTGDSKWITGAKARGFVHKLRGEVDAIMVGVNTIIRDDPLLSARDCFLLRCARSRNDGGAFPKAEKPVKVILDSKLRTPLNARIFSKESPAQVIIAACNASDEKAAALRDKGARPVRNGVSNGTRIINAPGKGGRVDVEKLLKELAKQGIASVLVEGGGETIASVLNAGVVDKAFFFIAPLVIGGKDAKTSVEGEGIQKLKQALKLTDVRVRRFGEDILVEGRINADYR